MVKTEENIEGEIRAVQLHEILGDSLVGSVVGESK